MPPRHSQQDQDGIVWSAVPLPLGTRGLDLRRADDPSTLSELANARFIDDRTVCRRDGHEGRLIQSEQFAQNGGFPDVPFTLLDEWVYGHGARVRVLTNELYEDRYYPIQTRGGGTFHFDGSDVVWTGDRVLVVSESDKFIGGATTHWPGDGARGREAYLPVQTEAVHPDPIVGTLVDVAVTDRYRVVASNATTALSLWVFDRNSGAQLAFTSIGSIVSTRLRVVNSGGYPVVLWIDSSNELKLTYYHGAWAAVTTVQAGVADFDVAQTPGGFHLVWRDTAVVKIGTYVGGSAKSTPFAFSTTVPTTGSTPDGRVTVAVSPGGDIAVAWNAKNGGGADKVFARMFTSTMQADGVDITTGNATLLACPDIVEQFTITMAYRGLRGLRGKYQLDVFGGRANEVQTWSITRTGSGAWAGGPAVARFNAQLASKAFRVGHEVFAWYRTNNSLTNYLVCSAASAITVCGIADREEAVAAPSGWVPSVSTDPTSPYAFHWIRKRNIGEYAQAGNARVGSLSFLNPLSAVQYGRSVYLAGSHVRNWDGVELGDAGFHDFPVVQPAYTLTTDGALPQGLFQVRIYPVRYNAKGERFQGAAVTHSYTLTDATKNAITWQFQTVPLTNHDDVELEVWRTPSGGGAFYYEGRVTNNRGVSVVQFKSTLSDASLRLRTADPFQTGVASSSLTATFGPIGCSTLVAAADRLWGFGGQVPAGIVQFSTLHSANRGAGFDADAGTQLMDAQGSEITSVANFNDATIVAFSKDRFYILVANGPDNYGAGSFGIPQMHFADGALNHAGTIVTPAGIAYWGFGGPRVLLSNLQVQNISEPVAKLANTFLPSGARVDASRCEVVWYSEGGDALLWNYSNGSRWARWTGLPIAGCSPTSLVTTDGRYLVQTEGVLYDDGRSFTFKIATGNVRPEQLLAGNTLLRRFGLVGEYQSEHKARFRIYYDNSPLWYQSITWVPETKTWLETGETYQDLTPAEIDTLGPVDRSGGYSTHHRAKKQQCQFYRLELSDLGHGGFIPWEFVFELGAKAGLARTAVNTFENQ